MFSPEVVARIGMRLKDHEIRAVIGEGGMGVVYRAQHVVLEKPVAIKVLHDRFASQTESIDQFILEAKAASRIRHPNIIDVTDIGTTDEGLVFLVMEYLEGENVEDRLRRVGRMAVFDAINVIRQVARGLGAAHELGIVHRDLKPANIFLISHEGRRRVVRRLADTAQVRFEVEPEGNYDTAKLLDFGVAKFLDLGPGIATRAGIICGTPYYLSPEQAQEKPASERSDIYALGAALYEMITGVVPFSGNSLLEILTGHVAGAIIPPSQRAPDAGIDPNTDAVVVKCLAKDPDDRFACADDVIDALRECVADRVFLRDAERLPGIREAGFDLEQSRSDARRRSSRSLANAPLGAPPLGDTAGDDGLVFSTTFNSEDFSDTQRFRRVATRGSKLPVVLATIVLLAGAGLALWLLLAKLAPTASPSTPATVATVATFPPAQTPPPAQPPIPQPPPVPTATFPERAKPPVTPTPPTTAKAPPGLRPAFDKGGRHAPFPPPPAPPLASVPAAEPKPPSDAVPRALTAAARIAGDPQGLLHEAQYAWGRQDYAASIYKARAALDLEPHLPLAHEIIALCSCALHRAEDATQAFAHLDPAKRTLVRTLCEKHGIVLPPE